MIPKEKANRLVSDFIKHSRSEKDIKPIQSAKKCALIAVNEILEAFNPLEYYPEDLRNYWTDVIIEIENYDN